MHITLEEHSFAAVDCGSLPNPPNGVVVHDSSTTLGSKVTYTCSSGYEQEGGDRERTCLADRQWSGEEIQCGGRDTIVTAACCIHWITTSLTVPQISMSVLRTVMAVSRCVRTQKGALSVAATLDMNSMEMAAHAVVCEA